MVISIYKQTGIKCFQHQPVWGCMCDKESYSQLPELKFNMIKDESGNSKEIIMPKESYMMYKTLGDEEGCFLKFTPWKW